MRDETILEVKPLGFPWWTADPFLFCVHHDDAYPAGTETLGPPREALAGRQMGQDFEIRDGWRMYHGQVVPGFPQHPHRGFETVTVVRRGLVDHADSLGATARYGNGDVQWLTTGEGIVHSEMFPLLNRDGPNPLDLFQIWLNLPKADKLVPAHFSMFWNEDVPRHVARDEDGRETVVTVVAGTLAGATPSAPPPHSWASRADSDVAIWTLELSAGARFTLPPARPGTNRTLYFHGGDRLDVGGRQLSPGVGIALKGEAAVDLAAGDAPASLLLLQGRPIGEPVAQYGPFVMNAPGEIRQAMLDYQRTGFGGWPWDRDDPVHPRDAGRFAIHADGREERAAG